MTTNIDRAAEVMREAHDKPHWSPMHRFDNIAQAIADAGLLMPILPKPEQCGDRLVWRVGDGGYVYIKPDGRIATIGVSNPYDSPSIAYRHALAIIAAANHPEQEQP